MGALDLLQTLRARGLSLAADGDGILVSPAELITDEARALIRHNKSALLAALARAANDSLSAVPVVRLRLVLEAEDGSRSEAVLAIPKARYDGLRVLELFERHRMAGTTRIISVRES